MGLGERSGVRARAELDWMSGQLSLHGEIETMYIDCNQINIP